jgi:uncharacterized beta-barrel protein YwiB (DUF1934 family)
MTLRAVKLSLTIHNHLDNSLNQRACINAKYDEQDGYLSYEEAEDATPVIINFSDTSINFKRLASTSTHIALILQEFAQFSVGSPALKGKSWLESCVITESMLKLHYQLYIEDELITNQTLNYTITEEHA